MLGADGVRRPGARVRIPGGYQPVRRHFHRTYGPSTPTVLRPTPLVVRARLQVAGLGLPRPATVVRPLSAYVTLVEEARQ